jgi:hypothetical protein
MAIKPKPNFESMGSPSKGMDKVYRPERDGPKTLVKGEGIPPRNPFGSPSKGMDKMYRPERDGPKRPAKGPGIPPRNPFDSTSGKPLSAQDKLNLERIKKMAIVKYRQNSNQAKDQMAKARLTQLKRLAGKK